MYYQKKQKSGFLHNDNTLFKFVYIFKQNFQTNLFII